MPSKWLPLRYALKYVQPSRGVNTWVLLLEHLQRGEINARAGTILEHKLTSFPQLLLDHDAPDEPVYIGDVERFLRIQTELASLPIGTTHFVLRGDRYTVVRDDVQATVFLAANVLAQSTLTELSPNFWQHAVVDFPQSFAVSDNLGALVRIEAFEIALSRDDVSRLHPSKALEEQGSPGKPRQSKYDWPAAKAEAERFIRARGVPKTLAILERHIADWFADPGKPHIPDRNVDENLVPNESHIRKHIAPIYQAAQAKKRS